MPSQNLPVTNGDATVANGDVSTAKIEGQTEDKKEKEEKSEKPAKNRILRYAEVFDLRTYETKLVKTGKPDKKLDKKKPVLVERRIINYKGIHTHTEVDIKSQALREFLIEINEDVEGLSLKKEPPFADPSLFFYSRHAIKAKVEQEEAVEEPDTSLVADLSVALQYVEEFHGKNIKTLENMLPTNRITWPLLWALLTPNALIYSYHQYTQEHLLMKMRKMSIRRRQNGAEFWHVSCDIIADDGLKFGYTKDLSISNRPDKFADIEIDEYEGESRIQDLPVYPLVHVQNHEQIRLEAIERGKKYVRITQASYFETGHGPALRETMNDRYEIKRFSFSTHGRAVIDTSAYRSNNPNTQKPTSVHSSLDRNALSEEQLMLCAPFIGGFSFGDKLWGCFAVTRLHQVVWTDEPFNSLVIGEKPKTLIRSLVKQHCNDDEGYDDIIQGKGLGLIGLLSGNPGCGKTLTAEAMAEVAHRPLYAISAGELGTEIEKVDQKLTNILELSHRWSAVLLLDEADVFLQKRDTKDVARNALVSIFLRQLEYYPGILILTTNRIGDCDPAFESRIHFSISYPDLDARARRLIWKVFLKKALAKVKVEDEFSETDIHALAEENLNGRQIKHLVGSARSIAREDEQVLNMSHIKAVLDVVQDWKVAKARLEQQS